MTPSLSLAKRISAKDMGWLLMALVSVAIIATPDEWLQTSFELVPTQYRAELVNDAYGGGNSKVRWLDEASQRWECELGQKMDEPSCSLQLDVTDAQGTGVDLSRFSTMTVWADYRGDATHLRLYLRNRHPNYYKPGTGISTKFNTIEVPVRALAAGLELPMDGFTVASWWLVGGNIPVAYSQPEFNEVSIVEMQTGSTVRSGTHEIQLKKIVWRGELVKRSTLYKLVIIAWLIVIFCLLAYRLLVYQRELKLQRAAQEELLATNNALNLETRNYEALAKTDALTGLHNRVGIRDVLHQGLMDWRDSKNPFSFIIADLDHFKEFNDTHGHDVGDEVLKGAAQVMAGQVRHTDALARWGGEEFVVACPDTTLDQAVQAAEKLRSALESQLTCKGSAVTASFGVATMDHPDLEELFKKADTALYKAKKLGRNRVCSERSNVNQAG